MASVEILSVGERPELAERLRNVGNDWPLFMLEDPVSKSRYSSAIDFYPDLQLVTSRTTATPVLVTQKLYHPTELLPTTTTGARQGRC